jgi:hypothetical protein
VRELGERVRREWCDHEDVCVDQMRIHVARSLAPGKGLEGVCGDRSAQRRA